VQCRIDGLIEEDTARLRLSGDLDVLHATTIQAKIHEYISSAKIREVVVSLGGLEFIDSMGINVARL
jgi:anti-anti-sigma factor